MRKVEYSGVFAILRPGEVGKEEMHLVSNTVTILPLCGSVSLILKQRDFSMYLCGMSIIPAPVHALFSRPLDVSNCLETSTIWEDVQGD